MHARYRYFFHETQFANHSSSLQSRRISELRPRDATVLILLHSAVIFLPVLKLRLVIGEYVS